MKSSIRSGLFPAPKDNSHTCRPRTALSARPSRNYGWLIGFSPRRSLLRSGGLSQDRRSQVAPPGSDHRGCVSAIGPYCMACPTTRSGLSRNFLLRSWLSTGSPRHGGLEVTPSRYRAADVRKGRTAAAGRSSSREVWPSPGANESTDLCYLSRPRPPTVRGVIVWLV